LRAVPTGRLADSRRARVLDAVEAIFEPIAQLLVSHGVSSPEAESLLRAVFVHEAVRTDASLRKRPNISRVALVTGVDRPEVARILKRPPKVDSALEARRHRVNRVLAGWYSDRDFVHGKRPQLLLIKANEQKQPTFWRLARRYAPGVYPGLILSELLRVGAVKRLQDGRVKVRMRRYRAGEFSDETLRKIGSQARGLLQTVIGNATATDWPHVCRAVETVDIDPKFLPLIRKMFADRSEAMLLGLQEELKSSRWKGARSTGYRPRIGLTVFSYEEGREEHASNETTKRTNSLHKRRYKRRRH
jgi:Family of unknown function (DUF6502)